MKRLFLALLGLALASAASAQTYTRGPTPDPGQYVPVMAMACQDGQGRNLPPGSPSCLAQQAVVSGTVTSNQGAPNAGGAQAWWVQWSGQSVAVSNFPATQPVSNAGTFPVQNTAATPAGTNSIGTVGLNAGSNTIGAVNQAGAPWGISGSVTATQGPAGTAPWLVSWSGQSVAVSNTVAVSQSGAWTVTQGLAGTTPWKVDGSSVTQPTSTAAGANVTEGSPSDAAYGGTGSASMVAALKGVYAALIAPTPAGSAVIGSTTLRSAGTNRSASVTTTASSPMAANTGRQGWKVKNDCTVPVWLNFFGTATATAGSGNIQVAAGAYLSSEPGYVETGALSAITASGTCALTIAEF